MSDGTGTQTAAAWTCHPPSGTLCHLVPAASIMLAISVVLFRQVGTARGRAAPDAGMPLADARLRVRAPRHQVCICVAPPIISLDFLRLCIEDAGRWVLAVLMRSIGVCPPILGSFDILHAALALCVPVLVLRSTWSSSLPALVFPQGPVWLEGVAASISRAEPLPAGCVGGHVAQMAGAPRVTWTASCPRVMALAAGGMADGQVPSQP